ncbi:tripartite tricarboxylate transporter substrate-binding protein [Limimaricola sp.]|uniref:tripartite tricarboxylate transporter substrate-binding protein n=1 Tax=Limimaricola sp. TaxID=2211665 RepID=UPI0025C516B2|nr:tripartite tricarboxylate transporter substrate-binding protein [Limimaricola sp.]
MLKRALLAIGLAVGLGSVASADGLVTLQVGYSPGGSYDLNARLVAEYLGKYLPGKPDVIVENVPGAGSLVLARQMMTDPTVDGTHLATISSALALAPVFDPDNTDFDPRKVHYIASLSDHASYCVTSKRSGITTFRQLLDSPDAKVGSTGRSSTTYTFPAAIRAALNGKFQIVTGFQGANEIDLAMERGDIQARCGIGLDTISQGDFAERINVVAELALSPQGEMEGPAFALDFAPDPAARAALALVFASSSVHHPIIAPPATPPAVVQTLRNAFVAVASDPAFIAENARRKTGIVITDGATVEAKIAGFLAAPADVQARARDYVR